MRVRFLRDEIISEGPQRCFMGQEIDLSVGMAAHVIGTGAAVAVEETAGDSAAEDTSSAATYSAASTSFADIDAQAPPAKLEYEMPGDPMPDPRPEPPTVQLKLEPNGSDPSQSPPSDPEVVGMPAQPKFPPPRSTRQPRIN